MSNFSDCYEGLDSTGRMIPTPWFARILKREGYDPDCNRGRAFDAAPLPDPDGRGRWPPDQALDEADKDAEMEALDFADENVFAKAYEARADQIFDSAKSATQKRFIGDNAAYQGRQNLEDYDLQMRQWTERYLTARTPAELHAAIAKFRAQCNDYTTPGSSVEHLLAYERAAERERTKPRTPRERIAAARWPWSAR